MRALAPVLALTASLAPTALAHADPEIPDFGSYPKAAAADFTVRDSPTDPVHAFYVPEGLSCASSSSADGKHILDCSGVFPGTPGGRSLVEIVETNGQVGPLHISATDMADLGDPPVLDGHPLAALAPKTTFAADDTQCVQDKGAAQNSTTFTPQINTNPNIDIAPKTSATPQPDPDSQNPDSQNEDAPEGDATPKSSAAPQSPAYQIILACVVGSGDQIRGFAITPRGMFVLGG